MSYGTEQIWLLADTCACGCQMVACPSCGDSRCLHCDPLCARAPCHEEFWQEPSRRPIETVYLPESTPTAASTTTLGDQR